MTGLWSAWVSMWARKEVGTSIALFRIGLGLCVVWSIAHLAMLGIPDAVWVDAEFGGYRKLGEGPWLVELLGGATPQVISLLVWLTVGLGLFVTLGIGGRVSVFCLLQSYMALADGNGHAGGSYDELLMNGLWLLVLAPSTATLSVDCWRRTGQWHSDEPVLAFGRYLVIFQLLLMYWTTGLQKVSAFWMPGGDFSALYYILQQPSWQRFDMGWIAPVFAMTQISTAASWFWEVSAPLWLLALWYDGTRERGGRVRALFCRWRVKWAYFLVGVIFHVTVIAFMEIGPFTFISLAFYSCLITPTEWERVATGLRRYRRPESSAAMAS